MVGVLTPRNFGFTIFFSKKQDKTAVELINRSKNFMSVYALFESRYKEKIEDWYIIAFMIVYIVGAYLPLTKFLFPIPSTARQYCWVSHAKT